jgi:hypothetical protein
MIETTLKPTLYFLVAPENPYAKPHYTVEESVLNTLDKLEEDTANPLEELGEVALNEETDTIRITRPFRLAGETQDTRRLEAIREIIEDLQICGYTTHVTTPDTLSTFHPLTNR